MFFGPSVGSNEYCSIHFHVFGLGNFFHCACVEMTQKYKLINWSAPLDIFAYSFLKVTA